MNSLCWPCYMVALKRYDALCPASTGNEKSCPDLISLHPINTSGNEEHSSGIHVYTRVTK